ncbi:porin family protein [Candidatus Korobacter versatilis]|nr:porin family protein [Candidatus Koribacter versatilis]
MRWISAFCGILFLTTLAIAQAPTPTGKLPNAGANNETPWMFSAQYVKPTNDWGPNNHFNGMLLDVTRSFSPRWGITGEFDWSKSNGHDGNQLGYRVGPRVNLITGHKVVPFAQFLLGGAHLHETGTRASGVDSNWNGVSWLGGGGVDILLTPHFGIRGQIDITSVPFGTHLTDRDYWPQYGGGVTYRW